MDLKRTRDTEFPEDAYTAYIHIASLAYNIGKASGIVESLGIASTSSQNKIRAEELCMDELIKPTIEELRAYLRQTVHTTTEITTLAQPSQENPDDDWGFERFRTLDLR